MCSVKDMHHFKVHIPFLQFWFGKIKYFLCGKICDKVHLISTYITSRVPGFLFMRGHKRLFNGFHSHHRYILHYKLEFLKSSVYTAVRINRVCKDRGEKGTKPFHKILPALGFCIRFSPHGIFLFLFKLFLN